jgi:hypothetical protein
MMHLYDLVRVSVAAALLMIAGAGPVAQAQPITIDGQRFASLANYLVGDWKEEHPEPRETRFMRFSRDGSFYFRNETTNIEHTGRFTTSSNRLEVTLLTTDPPKVLAFELAPQALNHFISEAEHWYRVRRH